MTKMVSNHLVTNQSTEIKTLNMLVNYEKNNVSALQTSFNMDDGQVSLPSFCDLLANVPGSDCQNQIVTQKVLIIQMKQFFLLNLELKFKTCFN